MGGKHDNKNKLHNEENDTVPMFKRHWRNCCSGWAWYHPNCNANEHSDDIVIGEIKNSITCKIISSCFATKINKLF